MESNREVLKIVVVGHVDHGKSTVIGRLLYDTKSIPEGKIESIKNNCKEKGKPFEYAYLLDAFEEEQKQGITIDTTQLQFFTKKRNYVIIDAPGHKEFLKNMISGAASAEAALLIIDAQEGIQEQSKRHGYILSLLGIQKVYVVLNKMDLMDYSQETFNRVKQEMNDFLKSINVYPLKYIPISAFYGENIISKSPKMNWYEGEPIISAIDLIEKDKGIELKPLRFPIQDVYKFDDRRIIAGRIESGSLKQGDEILISPSNKVTKVKTIEYWKDTQDAQVISAGMSVGITLEDEFFNKRGEFISHRENPPLITDVFRANIFWMGKNPLQKEKKYKLKIATQEVEGQIVAINKVIDATSLQILEDAYEVKINDVAEITIKTKENISFDEFKNNQNTGRFVLVEGYDVSGGGIITQVPQDLQTVCRFIKEGLEISVSCFDEYYYEFLQHTVSRYLAKPRSFAIKDAVPLLGDTYSYPSNLNVLDLEENFMAKIRQGLLHDIVDLDTYDYEGIEMISHRGLRLKINSSQELECFKKDLKQNVNPLVFANQWYDFMYFRNIKCNEKLETTDFEI